ncbi:type II toxin-antitoxin system VapC family toxin [Iningainema tapete]|uniref:Type II toxin-antitoxin system VapC family toxin n=1 Tax=Iningainema tapete BLCC-T55 TaxID=2748662 RepID=A0A8J6XV00_9CYAN|nr:type II toxin-antitoxin system VapC family toxin [Iningainema tapete]MBD2778885.1 type II toxin-antitoxin system VapC family toxin [Iningainema tapete BLCC-T55]
MKPKVYIETSIPSFYYEVRSEPSMVARRDWTRQWWDNAGNQYWLVTSVAVLDELNRGDFPSKDEAIKLISGLPLVVVEPAIAEIVQAYIQHQVMPKDPVGDALHLALASYHRCDFLLTWNCRHLANANKFGHIRRVNVMLGLYVPMLVTPLELMGEENDVEG